MQAAGARPTTSVLYDAQAIKRQRAGGISRYFVQVARRFRDDPGLGIDLHTAWRRSTNIHAVEAGLAQPVGGGDRQQTARYLAQRATTASPVLTRLEPRGEPVDIVHHTYYYPHHLGRYRATLTASTVHDMIPELLPEVFPKGNPHLAKEAYTRRSDLVFCPSEATRIDLERFYGPLAVSVVVVPHGVGAPFTDPVDDATHDPSDATPYALYVGERKGYKDFRVAALALHEAVRRSSDVPRRLVVVGGGPFSADERQLIRTIAKQVEVVPRPATDVELAALYRGAAMFLFPSRYEGFGIPTLEAMVSGCPVVLPHCSSHPEVAGEAGTYFAPEDVEDCAAGIVRLSEDRDDRRTRIEAGRTRAADFTWPATARQMADAYHRTAVRLGLR